jgi:hypothetical protein
MARKRKPAEPPRTAGGGSHTLGVRGLVPVQFAAAPAERDAFRVAAALAGFGSVSEWLRKVAVQAAETQRELG